MKYLLDSNAVIDILRDDKKVALKYQLETIKRNEIAICSIVYYEIIRGFKIREATKKLENFLQFSKNWTILPLDMKAIEKAVDIYVSLHKGFTVEDNDIYIAAIAMANDCTLITANEKHFSRIDGLTYENWRLYQIVHCLVYEIAEIAFNLMVINDMIEV